MTEEARLSELTEICLDHPAWSEVWKKTPWHCVHCGRQHVWVESTYGDVGHCHLCIACGFSWHLPYAPAKDMAFDGARAAILLESKKHDRGSQAV